MEEQNANKRPVNPRRRRRTKFEIIKEDYLPAIIVIASLILILIFVVGSIVRGVERTKYKAELSRQEAIAAQEEQARLDAEAARLMEEAAVLAKHFDYDSAIALMDTFSGNMYDYVDFSQRYADYAKAAKEMVLWDDPNQVLNLSFQPLIADPDRAFADETYGTSFYNNYITVDEFAKILQQLYENGYILIRYSDIRVQDDTMELYLPKGKKPLIITETHVNYNTYMIDGDGDKLPDKDGSGFASKLILDENGNLSCEMVDSNGQTVTGAYDIVPILESFIATHPDFSYRGARAVLALSGYDGLFGYRTGSAAEEYFGKAYRDQQAADVANVIQAVKDTGYELACYTYENEPYGNYSADRIRSEMELWADEVTPLLGNLTLFVFSRNSDIAENGVAYSDSKFEVLKEFGFTDFVGFSTDGKPWFNSYDTHSRMGRILVTGSNIANHADWFSGVFDAYSVKDNARN
ncbi:MAG: hypothetical protein J6Q54_09030 [Oscillospiraceae bacterium]|nr:hypothetical protein [Oscillospiraceae bacterium]